jgi:ankyrin repeat protein
MSTMQFRDFMGNFAMNYKAWLALLLMLITPVSFAQFGMTQEQLDLYEKIEDRDWAYIRSYMNQQPITDSSRHNQDFVLRELIKQNFNDIASELIEGGVLANLVERDYVELVELAMVTNNLEAAESLLQQYSSLPVSASPDSMYLPLVIALSGRHKFIPLLLAAGVDLNEPVDDESPLALALRLTKRPEWDPSVEGHEEEPKSSAPPEAQVAVFWLLVENGADIDLVLNRGEGIVAEAAMLGDLEIFNYIFAHGGNVNDRSDDETALMKAAVWGHNYMETIPYLLSMGADVCLENKDGLTAYDLALMSGIVEAAKRFPQMQCREKIRFSYSGLAGDIEIMEHLLAQGTDVNDIGTAGTALMWAASFGDNTSQSIPFLLEHGADVCATDAEGLTAYDKALSRSRLDALKTFPELLCTRSINFHLAGFSGDVDIMRFLLDQGADINSVDKWGFSALINAVSSPNRVIAVPFLLDAGADVCIANKVNHRTAYDEELEFAVANSGDVIYDHTREEAITLMKANPQLLCLGKLDLPAVARTGDVELLESVLDRGANINEPSRYGSTALQVAVGMSPWRNRPAIVSSLLAHGADVCLRSTADETVYQIAVREFRSAEELALLPDLICDDNSD